MNAKNNPNGVVDTYLSMEKHRVSTQKVLRKTMRPSTSLSTMKTSKPKRVEDFFRADDNLTGREIKSVILQRNIASADGLRRSHKDVKEKINGYMQSMRNYQELMEINAEAGITAEKFEVDNNFERADRTMDEAEASNNGTPRETDANKFGFQTNRSPEESDGGGNYIHSKIDTTLQSDQVDKCNTKISLPTRFQTTSQGFVLHTRTRRSTATAQTLSTKEFFPMKNGQDKYEGLYRNSQKNVLVSGSKAIIHALSDGRPKSGSRFRPDPDQEYLTRQEMLPDYPAFKGTKRRFVVSTSPRHRMMAQREKSIKKKIDSMRGRHGLEGVPKISIDGSNILYGIQPSYSSALLSNTKRLEYEMSSQKSVLKSWINNESHPHSYVKGVAIDPEKI
jgi:hypothetical protein